MRIDAEATFGIGHVLSVAVMDTLTGENEMSGVQHNVPTAGFVPTTVKVAPGSKAAAFETNVTLPPGSASEKGISTQKGRPSHTSMPLAPTINPPTLFVRPVVTGGVPMQFTTITMKSRMMVPMGTPAPLYVVTSMTTT
jgi:hypothetical protein